MAEIHSQSLAHHNNMSTHNNVENKTHNGSTSPEINIPEVELLIKASTIDGRRKGACLFCQEYFMELYLLAELKTITLKVTTVDMQKPPPDFRSKFEAAYPPILIHSGAAVVENDQVERHIMKEIPGGHNLFVQDRETEACVEALYKRLKLLLTQPQSESARIGLLNSLRTIDAHLQKNWSSTTGNGNNNSQQQNSALRFLTGDSICCFDCELMPRLQHVRVAGEFFCQFHIPTDLHALWRYMANMYRLPAFLESCPSDQDIIHHYKQQLHLKVSRKEELEQPTMTKTVPAAALGRGVGNPANNSDAEDEDDE